MKDTSQLEVQQLRIFPVDKLPLVELATPMMAETFARRLGGARAAPGQPGELNFVGGTLLSDNGGAGHVIKVVQLTDRKLTVAVQGGSSSATRAYQLVAAFMAEIGHPPGEPLILTEQTTCVATLDFDWHDLIDPRVAGFVQGTVADVLAERATVPELRYVGLSFRFAFPQVPEKLAQHGITLAEKTVTIEPRRGAPLSERRYFTASPTGSDTHLSLLEALEAQLAPSRQIVPRPKGGPIGRSRQRAPK